MYEIVRDYLGSNAPLFSMLKSVYCPQHEFSMEREPTLTGCRAVVHNRTRRPIVVRWKNGIEVLLEPQPKENGWKSFEEEVVNISLEVTARGKEFSRKVYNIANNPIDYRIDEALQEEHNFRRYGKRFRGIPSPGMDVLRSDSYGECNLNYKVQVNILFHKPYPNEHLISEICGLEIFTDIDHPEVIKTDRILKNGPIEVTAEEAFKEIEDNDNGYRGEQLLVTNAYVIDRKNQLCDYFTLLHGSYYQLPRRNNVIGEDGVYVQLITGRNEGSTVKHYFTVQECIEGTAKLNALGLYTDRNDVFQQKNSKHIQDLNNQIEKLHAEVAKRENEINKRDAEIKKLCEALAESNRREERLKDDIKHAARLAEIEKKNEASQKVLADAKFLHQSQILKDEIISLQRQLKYTKETGKFNKTGEVVKNATMIFSLITGICRLLL